MAKTQTHMKGLKFAKNAEKKAAIENPAAKQTKHVGIVHLSYIETLPAYLRT